MTEVATAELEQLFGKAAGKIRRRLWLRRVLSGAAGGLVLGSLAAAALWWLRQGELRPYAAALGLVGAGAGALVAARKRWSDEEVALYLDHQLGSRERIVTALGVGNAGSASAAHLRASAAEALERGADQLKPPRWLDAPQLALPVAATAIAWLSLAPLPPAPRVSAPPGVERVQQAQPKGLERIEALRDQRGRNPEDERRLRALAEDAQKLRSQLRQGMEKREALARMAKLRDAIAELRSDFGSGQQRPGLEAAIGALAEHPELRKAARALGDGDLTAFDQEMQRLANQAEQSARESAKQALQEAERAARAKGAQALGDALQQQAEAFQKRAAEAEALRELAKSMEGQLDAEALEDLKEFGQSGDPEAARRLAEAMGKALSKLSEADRKRLAERMKQQLEQSPQGALSPMTREEMADMARRLATADGQRQLEEQLRELAKPEPSPGAERDGALGDAERGLDEAERGLGAVPLPTPGEPATPGAGNSPGGPAPGNQPGPGGKRDTGRGDHAGKTDAVQAPELRAKADVARSGSGPMHAATLGRAPARPGDTANQRGSGSLGSVAPAEIGAVEQSEVPEEYREHVGRYFEP